MFALRVKGNGLDEIVTDAVLRVGLTVHMLPVEQVVEPTVTAELELFRIVRLGFEKVMVMPE